MASYLRTDVDILEQLEASDSDFEEQSTEINDLLVNNVSESETSDADIDISDNVNECGDAPLDPWHIWKEDDANFSVFTFDDSNCGYKATGRNNPSTPYGFFQLIFTDVLFKQIADETNRYAQEKIKKVTPLPKFSSWWGWTDVTLNEMKAFHGVLLNMAMKKNDKLQDFFSREWLDSSQFFVDCFSRKRFFQIFWALHVSPPDSAIGLHLNPQVRSRLSKVKNILDYISEKFLEIYKPHKHLAADESTVSFRGRVLFKMYNPQKPTKWGLRIYVISDSTNGYVCSLIPYYGAVTTESLIRPDLTFTERIVLQLVANVTNATGQSGYHIYTDRFYTGVTLANELLKQKIHITGTVQSNRKHLPDGIRKNKMRLKKHETKCYRTDSMMVLAWHDKRTVWMLSTNGNNLTTIVERKNRSGVEQVTKPTVIVDYTSKMGGVDRSDHYISSYGFVTKSLKWWRKLYFWLLEVALVNSFLLYKDYCSRNNLVTPSHKTFRKMVIKDLVGEVRNKGLKRGRPSTSDVEERLNGKLHVINKLPDNKHKDCAVCSNRNKKGGRKETVFYCETCSRKPALHPENCFKKYHTCQKFKE